MSFLQVIFACIQMVILGIGLAILIVVPSIMAGMVSPLAGLVVFVCLCGTAWTWGGWGEKK